MQAGQGDIRRFLRYVFPGLVLIVETATLLSIANPLKVRSVIVADLKLDAISSLLTILVLSGGAGYVLGLTYNFVVWLPVLPFSLLCVDYREFLRLAIKRQLLALYLDSEEGVDLIEANCLSARGAWRVVTGIWHARMPDSKVLKESFSRCESLADLMHGAGAACAASLAAAVMCWFLDKYDLIVCVHVKSTAAVAVMLIVIHSFSYWSLRNNAQRIVELILLQELQPTRAIRIARRPISYFALQGEIPWSERSANRHNPIAIGIRWAEARLGRTMASCMWFSIAFMLSFGTFAILELFWPTCNHC